MVRDTAVGPSAIDSNGGLFLFYCFLGTDEWTRGVWHTSGKRICWFDERIHTTYDILNRI